MGARASSSRSPSTTVSQAQQSRRSNLSASPSPSRAKDRVSSIPLSTMTLLDEPRPPPRIKILDFHVEIENKPTSIDETSSSVLKYKTPQFKSNATFQISPIDGQQNWKVGWIQACTHMEFFSECSSNRLGDATACPLYRTRHLRRLRLHVLGVS